MKTTRRHFPFLSVLALLLIPGLCAHAATITWTNVNGGVWNAATNWSPNQVPGAGDTAVITAAGTYTVTVDIDPTVAALTLGGASGEQTLLLNSRTLVLTNASAVNANGVIEQNGGAVRSDILLTTSGVWKWNGGALRGIHTVAPGGMLLMESGTPELQGTITNAGTMRWTSGVFFIEDGNTLYNLGTFEADTFNPIQPFGAGPNRFINQGTFRKAGQFNIDITVEFINTGTVEIQQAPLRFPNGFVSSGNFDVAADGALYLQGGTFTLNSGHTFSGAGFYGIQGGTATIIGDLAAPNFQLSGGILIGTNRLTGTLRWNGGALRGIHTVAPGGMLLMEFGAPELQGTITNAGTMRWTSGVFFIEDGNTLYNLGTFEADTFNPIQPFGAGPNRFINQGTFRKTGVFNVDINVEFINTGTVEIQQAPLRFPNGFVSSGNFDVAADGALHLQGGTFTLNSGHTFSGAGFYGINGGTATIIGDLTAPNFQLSGGILIGTNRLTGTLHWNGGILRGIHTVAPGGMLLMEFGAPELQGTITNAGTMRWTSGVFFIEDGNTLYNLGTFEADTFNPVQPFGAGPNRFINQGIFRKAGPFTIDINVEFINTGTIDITGGSLRFPDGFTQTAGSTLLNGGNLRIDRPFLIQGGSLGGAGTVTGDIDNSGQLNPGIARGLLNISGNYTQRVSGTLNIELAGVTPDTFDQLAISGTASLNGSLNTILANGFGPPTNSTYPFLTAGTRTGTFANHTYPSNQVEFQINYTANSATLQVINVFTNVSQFPPVLAEIADRTIDELTLLQLTATATDADVPANILTWRLDAAPAGAAINPTNGVLTWTPAEADGPGTHNFTVRVTDNGSLFDTETFSVTVREVNQTPTLNPIPRQVIAAGTTLTFTASASDADQPAQPLTYDLLPGAPAGASINPSTGEFTWPVPANQPAGTVNVTVRVTDDPGAPPATPLNASQIVVIEVDRTGPRVLAMTPTNQVSSLVDHIDLTFDSALNPATLATEDISLTATNGPITVTVGLLTTNVVRISFATLAPGDYTLTVGPAVNDIAGNAMNQDGDATNGEPLQDRFTGHLSIGLADLRVTSINAPAQAVVGQPVQIIWSITNQGNATAFAPWFDSVGLAENASGANEQTLAFFQNTNTLASGQSITRTQSVILPSGTSGPRFIVLRTDVFSQVLEPANDDNNILVDDQLINILAPDLIVTALALPSNAQFGQSLNVIWTVQNAGTGPAPGSWSDYIYLTPASNSFSGARFLASAEFETPPLNAGASYTRTQNVTFPLTTDLSDGGYFVMVNADANNAQPEVDEGNNLRSRAVTIAAPPLPDLAVQNILGPTSAEPGELVTISWVITNRGTLQATGVWTETLSFSNQPPLATFSYTNILPPGASLARTQAVVIPAFGAAGALLFTVETDSGRDVFESNETNNVSVAGAVTTVAQTLSLLTAVSEIREDAFNPNIQATVTRNGNRDNPLVVTLTSSETDELTVPPTVTIPAGQVTAAFQITVQRDGMVDGARPVTITAAANTFTSGSALINVLDADLPRLALSFAQTNIMEPTNTIATVTRDLVTADALVVQLSSSDTAQLSVPTTVTIPAFAVSANFTVQAAADTLVDAPRLYTVSASAPDFVSASATILVTDDDIPQVTVSLAPTEVSEGAGALATSATVTRDRNSPRALVVAVESSNVNAARTPSTVTIPGGEVAVSFPVAAVDNDIIDGTKNATIRAFVNDPATGVRLSTGTPATLQVRDDDGPTLRVEISRAVVAEGQDPAATATVTRNSSPNSALVVNLLSSDTSEITAPATVTIPANETSASFSLASLSDGVTDGDQSVTVTASATGFTSGSAMVVVTDRNLPDLTAALLSAPTNATTDASVQISFRFENKGLADATGSIAQSIFLSPDPVVGDDLLVDRTTFTGSLPPGAHLDQTLTVRLPGTTGDYWVVVTTDSDDNVSETLENNNTTISAQPITVIRAYSATVETDVTVALAGTPVPLRGQATLLNGQPAVFSPVNIHLSVRETMRIISAITDQAGRYSIMFQPLPGEAGSYQVGADHPGVKTTPVQDTFTLLGLRVTPATATLKVLEGGALTSSVRLFNLSDVPLTGLAAEVIEKPANLQVALNLTNSTLPGLQEDTFEFTLTPTDTSLPGGVVLIRFSSPSGVTADLRLLVTIELARPQLVATPSSLVVGMKRGGQASVQFQVSNDGGAASGDIDVLLPSLPWLTAASGARLPSLAPGASNTITLVLTPPADLALGDHRGNLLLASAAQNLSVPFTFRALSESVGDLKVIVEDEYTYYAAGSPKVSNAVVIVTDELSGAVVTNGVTDARGELVLTNLLEAYYRIDVSAEGHSSLRSTILVAAGMTNNFVAFINRETVKYIWTVVPTEIEDRTKFIIETVFETVVPIPVVTVEPMLIDLANFQGTVTQVNLKISNHGLLAAENTRLVFEEDPDFSITALVTNLGSLRAKSSVTVPVIVRRLNSGGGGGVAAGRLKDTGGGCDLRGATLYDLLCGPVVRGNGIPILFTDARSGCGGSGGAGFAGFTDSGLFSGGGGGGGIADSGGGPSHIAPSFAQGRGLCNPCTVAVVTAAADCALEFLFIATAENVAGCIKDALQCGFGRFTQDPERPDPGTTYTCTKFVYECFQAAGEAVGEVLGGKLITALECVAGFFDAALTCASAGGPPEGGAMRTSSPYLKSLARPELDGFELHWGRFEQVRDVERRLFGDEVWLQSNVGVRADWLKLFLARIESNSVAGIRISAEEQGFLRAAVLPAPVTGTDVDTFVERWNRSIDYWARDRFYSTEVPAGENGNFLAVDVVGASLVAATNVMAQSEAEGFASVAEGVVEARADLVRFYEQSAGGGDCATVRLKIEQEAVITRDAFDASLEIINSTGDALENVSVELVVRNENGEVTTSLFGIRAPVLSGLSAVDGSGVIGANSSGKASWIIIPTSEAAPAGPTLMAVSGTLKYRQAGVDIAVPLAPAGITVLPNASLAVKYFNQRDVFSDDPFTEEVEPAIPFSLGVLIENKGLGAARNVRLTSAQPKIIENEKGLLIDFEIIATEVAGENLSPSLTANFGNIGPGEIGVGRWLLRSSLQGLFVDYEASFEHLDGLGDPRLSLVESVEIHELIHLVRAEGTFEDGKPDFLANDVPDLDDRPDTLHLSGGGIEPVNLVTAGSVDGAPSAGDLEVQLTAALPAGWTYLRIAEPGNGQFPLTRVRRADGTEVALDFNVWTTDRTFIGNAQRPIRENILHLLDYNSAGSYTLTYGEAPGVDSTPPESAVEVLPPNSFAQIPVRWSGADGSGSGIEFFDIFVSINGGPFNPWLQRTALAGGLYDGNANESVAFYSVATDRAGNREPAPGAPDTETSVSLVNGAPSLTLPGAVTIDEGATLAVTSAVSDPDGAVNSFTFSLLPGGPAGAVIDEGSGLITWLTGEGNGPSTNVITVRVTDNGAPSLSATSVVQVVVREINQAPELAALADETVAEGILLTFAVTATDGDLPANEVTFSLGAGAPTGASVTSAGVFRWTPSPLQGPSTNRLAIIATDNGSPSMSSTQSLTVIVRDSLGDFTVRLGSTHFLAGQSASVPILLSSGDLTSLAFTVTNGARGLTNFSLTPLAPEIASASLGLIGPNAFTIQLATLPGLVLQGNERIVAQLNFDTVPGTNSAIVPLRISELDATRSTGALLENGIGRDGRIIVIGAQPVLEAVLTPSRTLLLYGRPGGSFVIEFRTNLAAGVWTPLARIPLTNSVLALPQLDPSKPAIFYRAYEFVADPALLEVSRTFGSAGLRLLLYGKAGRGYELQSTTDLSGNGVWSPEPLTTLSNSFLFFDRTNSGPRRFFRVRQQ